METSSPVPQSTPSETKPECGVNCKDCLKGGLPIKREWLSFITLTLFTMLVILFVFFVQAKRDLSSTGRDDRDELASSQAASPSAFPVSNARSYPTTISLPTVKNTGTLSVEKAIATRRSRREFSDTSVTLAELGQMLWSGQGITDSATGKRTAPSARESYPMTLFVVVKRVSGLEPGLYEYIPKTHALGKMAATDLDPALKEAGVQEGAQKAPVVFLISASFGNYQAKTKSANVTATYMEAGHIGQNMYLEAESLDMAMVVMAGFDSSKVTQALQMDGAETIEYVVPFGHRAPELVATPVPKE
ncbi:MAG: SagB/ThcOx family dehydrogenase [Candidatus Woesebacteria bacterium]